MASVMACVLSGWRCMSERDSGPTRGIKRITLQPGDWFVGNASHQIATLLGSCISITVWHPLRRIGAMSHFLLPSRGGTVPWRREGRFGDEALSLMLERLAQKGVDTGACEAKIFGGGNMFPCHFRDDAFAVGRRNGEAAREMLSGQGIRVVSESLYGLGHRQVIFDVASGDVWVRHAAQSSSGEAA